MIKRLTCIPIGVVAVALVAIPHLISILLRWHQLPLLPGEVIGSPDPDPWLRLLLVRDWLNGGGWYNHVVAQSNAPWGGIASPWTRPLDILIATLVKLQPDDVELNTRLIRAAMLVPWLAMLALLAGTVRAIRILTPVPAAQLLGVAILGSAPLMWNYFSFAYADHHSLLTALFVWTMGGIITPAPSRRLITFTGMLMALMLWISPEALALIGLIYLWFGICWLRGEAEALPTLCTLATATALSTTASLLLEVLPAAWRIPVYDSISIIYVFILSATALAVWLLRALHPTHLQAKYLLTTLIVAALLAALWLTYPLVFRGPLAAVHPYIISDFMPNITEAQPLFIKGFALSISFLLHPLTALALCGLAALRTDTIYDRRTALMMGFFISGTLALFLAQVRWNYYCYPLVAITLAPWLGALFNPTHAAMEHRWPATWLARLNEHQQMARRLPLLVALFTLPLAAAYFAPAKNNPARERFDSCAASVRRMTQSGQLSALLGNQQRVLFTHTNFGGEIMFFTNLRIIASNYHREGEGIQYLWESYKITDMNSLRRTLAERKVEALLLCPDTSARKDSVLVALTANAPLPSWLKRIEYTPYPAPKDASRESTAPVTHPLLLIVMH